MWFGDTVYPRYFGDKPLIIVYIKNTTKTLVFPSGKTYRLSYDLYGCSPQYQASHDGRALEFCRIHLSKSPLAGETGDGNHQQLTIEA